MDQSKKLKFPIDFFITLIFVIEKLLGFITWSWIWVLSPIWIGTIIGIIFSIIITINKNQNK